MELKPCEMCGCVPGIMKSYSRRLIKHRSIDFYSSWGKLSHVVKQWNDSNSGKHKGWIPVSEELPSEKGYYIVCHKNNLPFCAAFNVWGDENFTVVGGGEQSVISNISHWMPIPESPKN